MTVPDEKRPNDEIYDLVSKRAENMLEEATILVGEANTLHRMCEIMRPGEFYPVKIETDFEREWDNA